VQKKVLKANPFKKSLEEMSPATGLSRKLVCNWRKEEIDDSWGIVSREYEQCFFIRFIDFCVDVIKMKRGLNSYLAERILLNNECMCLLMAYLVFFACIL
jgi:hypothetical protein